MSLIIEIPLALFLMSVTALAIQRFRSTAFRDGLVQDKGTKRKMNRLPDPYEGR